MSDKLALQEVKSFNEESHSSEATILCGSTPLYHDIAWTG